MKYILLAAGLIAATTVSAQDNESRYDKAMKDYHPRIGIKGGVNSANITIDNAGNVNDRRAIPGWHAGLMLDLPLLPVLSIQPAVLLSSKGAKYRVGDESSNNYTEVRTRPLYLEVPVNAVVKIPLPNKVRLFAGAGPYVAYGIGGKNSLEGKVLGVSFSDDEAIEYSNDDPRNGSNGSRYEGSLKRFDFGLNILAGLEISHFVLNANYGYGVVNIRPGADNDEKYNNRVGSVSVGFLF